MLVAVIVNVLFLSQNRVNPRGVVFYLRTHKKELPGCSLLTVPHSDANSVGSGIWGLVEFLTRTLGDRKGWSADPTLRSSVVWESRV